MENGQKDASVASVFPTAYAPDIIRANQKDSYIQSLLKDNIENVLRRWKGSRFLHNYSSEINSSSSFLYLALTTLIGARTLGEEYCDIFYVGRNTRSLPSWKRRAGFVVFTSVGPMLLQRLVTKLKMKLEKMALKIQDKTSNKYNIVMILKKCLDSSVLQAAMTIHLAIFYFFGSYYQITKRIWGLRYAFGHRLDPLETRGGYEVLGLLILSQFIVKGFNKFMESNSDEADSTSSSEGMTATGSEKIEVDLENSKVLPFIPSSSRTCTLCLSLMKNPTSTLCGHLFCWTCASEWVREKPECPLCRQGCLEQNLLPLRA